MSKVFWIEWRLRGDNMVKPIMKDIFFLNQKSEPATKADNQVVQDLLDTLKANEAGCVGMALHNTQPQPAVGSASASGTSFSRGESLVRCSRIISSM
jgi:hypothetical protein